jgi:hypothetical protein
MSIKLLLEGLNSLDAEELKEAVGVQAVEFVAPEVPEGTIAEPTAITALITLTPIVAATVSAYLAKPRHKKFRRSKFRTIHPDGRIVEREWETRETTEEAIKSQLLSQLTKWLKG